MFLLPEVWSYCLVYRCCSFIVSLALGLLISTIAETAGSSDACFGYGFDDAGNDSFRNDLSYREYAGNASR